MQDTWLFMIEKRIVDTPLTSLPDALASNEGF